MSYIHSIQISFPEHECKQEEIRNLVSSLWPDKHEIIYQFFESTTVKSRNLALPLLDYQKIGHFGDRNNIWKKVALELQKKNIINLFANNSISPNDINLIVSVNSTGLCVPTLDALLMNQFKFNRNLKRLPLFGLGCLGGVAGINRVDDYLSGNNFNY
jgi:alkylresorcinol/alkylpyrone synthase